MALMDYLAKAERLRKARTNARAKANYEKNIEARRRQSRESQARQRKADPEKKRRQTRAGMARAYAQDPQKFINRAADYHANRKEADPAAFNDRARTKQQNWRNNNLEHARRVDRERQKRLRQTDIQFNLASVLRSRLRAVVVEGRAGSAVRDLGCTLPELVVHLEEQFTTGMSWDNYGDWHIDHRVPLSLYDLTDRDQLLTACHFANLQPRWAKENLSKGARLEPPSFL